MFDLNPEKLEVLKSKGNILVTANPGTGKTLLLANKYLDLVTNGLKPEQILCLTFTEKAKREMEHRIIKLLSENNIKPDLSSLNIYTFHSYAFENIEQDDIISPNLLRFAIYKFLKDNEIFNYGDQYLIGNIVPKLENLIRYLKSFGITPDKIDIETTKSLLEGNEKITTVELHKYADHFVDIFRHYENIKVGKGPDYADLLIEFLKQNRAPQFEVVLIDELQDVNKMEADIALSSANHFFAVGDKKQAIFGFQGGSILNFSLFENSSRFILSENFRSTNQILYYAREYFISKTEDQSHKKELENLKSAEDKIGEKPVIYEVEKKSIPASVCGLVQELSQKKGNIAIIARTNSQIMKIAKEMTSCEIEYSTTFFSASTEAKRNIINFLKGILSNRMEDIKNSMFTPYFPISLQDAFQITEIKDLTLESLYENCPEFYKLRSSIKTVEDVNKLFKEIIMPVSVTYGKDYFLAAVKIQNAYQEALELVDDKTINNLTTYLDTADLLSDEIEMESKVVLTTVHKAKGKEFDTVIYVPSKPPNNSNFQDQVVEAILQTKEINVQEELEEEALRINFVAFTRAKKNLYILAEKTIEYLNDYIDERQIEVNEIDRLDFSEAKKKAFSLFVNGEFDEAKELLQNKEKWLIQFVKSHFDSLEHISFSTLTDDPYEYLMNRILRVREYSPAMNLGSDVHTIAEKIVKEEEYEVDENLQPYKNNIESILDIVRNDYNEIVDAEKYFKIPLNEIIETDESIYFSGVIDAIFKSRDKYLIVDWKTDRTQGNGSKHRQQLEVYKRALCKSQDIEIENVKVAIGFIGLRPNINTGEITFQFDDRQPQNKSFDTFSKKVKRLLEWKKDPKSFIVQMSEKEIDDVLWRSIVEQYKHEMQ